MWSSISEICRTEIMLQISHHILRVDMHCMATLRMRFFIFSGLCVQSYFYTRATSFSEMICNKWQHWEWGFEFVRYIWPKLMLCMHWLILRREMQYVPTLKVRSSISETCLTRIKSANVWPHSQRLHARNDNTEKEVLIFSDFCGQNYFYTWATSFSKVTWNEWQHWEWGFQFVIYISPKLMLCMHWLILRREMQYMPTLKVKSSISETCLARITSANVWPHSQRWHAINDNTENVVINFWDLSDRN